MSNSNKTARRDARTAGKTAMNDSSALCAAKGKGRWRETTRKGEKVLVSPAGRIYHGTAQEVHDAALTPWQRGMLADSLRLELQLRRSGTFDAVGSRELCARRRRDAVMFSAHDRTASVEIPADVLIKLNAGARLVGFDSVDDFFADLWDSELRALLDFAETETGKREIPLTRQERAALDRLRAERKSA